MSYISALSRDHLKLCGAYIRHIILRGRFVFLPLPAPLGSSHSRTGPSESARDQRPLQPSRWPVQIYFRHKITSLILLFELHIFDVEQEHVARRVRDGKIRLCMHDDRLGRHAAGPEHGHFAFLYIDGIAEFGTGRMETTILPEKMPTGSILYSIKILLKLRLCVQYSHDPWRAPRVMGNESLVLYDFVTR